MQKEKKEEGKKKQGKKRKWKLYLNSKVEIFLSAY